MSGQTELQNAPESWCPRHRWRLAVPWWIRSPWPWHIAGEIATAQLAQSWGPHVLSKSTAPHPKAAAPDPARYCFVPCTGYPGCYGAILKPTGQHAFFLLTAYQSQNTIESAPHQAAGMLSRLGQQEHPCLLCAGFPDCPHTVTSTIFTCSRDGSM